MTEEPLTPEKIDELLARVRAPGYVPLGANIHRPTQEEINAGTRALCGAIFSRAAARLQAENGSFDGDVYNFPIGRGL
jgi:hypothetical protein